MRPVPDPKITIRYISGSMYAVYDDPWTGKQCHVYGSSNLDAERKARERILIEHQLREEDRLTYGESGRPSARRVLA